MTDKDRIFHLEVLCGLRPPEPSRDSASLNDAYSTAAVYFNCFMRALGARPRCGVCNRFHEEYGDD